MAAVGGRRQILTFKDGGDLLKSCMNRCTIFRGRTDPEGPETSVPITIANGARSGVKPEALSRPLEGSILMRMDFPHFYGTKR